MPPVDHRLPCPPLEVTTAAYNVTTKDTGLLGNEDLNALLYIVVTLLFYSLGIIIGIISYLKREKRELEENKTFDFFLNLKNDPFTATKLRRVQIVTERLEQLERERQVKKVLEENENERLMAERQGSEGQGTDDSVSPGEDSEDTPLTKTDNEKISQNELPAPETESLEATPIKGFEPRRLLLKKQGNVFQTTPSGEPISSVVAKIFDSERRGGLPNSPKALHLFKSRGHLSRDYSLDSQGRGSPTRDQSPDTGAADIELLPKLRKNDGGKEVKDTSKTSKQTPDVSSGEPDGCLVTNV